MIITREILIKYGATCEGTDIFCRFFPHGFDTKNWSYDMQIKILTKTRLRKYLGWAWGEKLIPMYSMTHTNLRNANLQDANLRSADLQRANLRGADLRDANLLGANLRGADLQDADLRFADLQDANLRGADLQDANLRGADLQDANLLGADLLGAKLSLYQINNLKKTRSSI